MQKTKGHPSAFTDEQNTALRAALREHQSAKRLSQTALGRVLGVSQQVTGRLLADRGGFSYATASRLVRALGYASVDTFFRAKGVLMPDELPQAKSA